MDRLLRTSKEFLAKLGDFISTRRKYLFVGDRLERAETLTRILGVWLAGLFALFTWGVDIASKREASWKLEIKNTSAIREEKIFGMQALEVCRDQTLCNTVACKFTGKLEIINNGLRPLELGKTTVEAFLVKKTDYPSRIPGEDGNKFDKNVTPSILFKQACMPTSDSELEKDGICTRESDFATEIEPLDESPLFPGVNAWRPYGFRIHKGVNINRFMLEHGLLIRVRQDITAQHPIWLWQSKTASPSALLYLPTPCNFGFQVSPLQ